MRLTLSQSRYIVIITNMFIVPEESNENVPAGIESVNLYNDQFWTDLEWALNIPD